MSQQSSGAAGGRGLRIAHLYPELLNLYGDSGNILCLRKRLEWRGMAAEERTSC